MLAGVCDNYEFKRKEVGREKRSGINKRAQEATNYMIIQIYHNEEFLENPH